MKIMRSMKPPHGLGGPWGHPHTKPPQLSHSTAPCVFLQFFLQLYSKQSHRWGKGGKRNWFDWQLELDSQKRGNLWLEGQTTLANCISGGTGPICTRKSVVEAKREMLGCSLIFPVGDNIRFTLVTHPLIWPDVMCVNPGSGPLTSHVPRLDPPSPAAPFQHVPGNLLHFSNHILQTIALLTGSTICNFIQWLEQRSSFSF